VASVPQPRTQNLERNGMKPLLPESSLAAEAYVFIRERILRGEIAIGQVISRRKIAADLGMSFLPVSEAFLRLEFEGVLESRPRAGTRVHIPSPADVEGHYVVREALEMQAARLFATRAKSEERCELVQLGMRLDGLSLRAETDRAETDPNVQWRLHETFHRRIAECAACPTLNDAIENTCALSSAWLWAGSVFLGKRPMNHHQHLAEVLGQGDPEMAAHATREHLHASKQWALAGLAPYFELAEKQTQTYSRTAALMLHAIPVLSDAPPS